MTSRECSVPLGGTGATPPMISSSPPFSNSSANSTSSNQQRNQHLNSQFPPASPLLQEPRHQFSQQGSPKSSPKSFSQPFLRRVPSRDGGMGLPLPGPTGYSPFGSPTTHPFPHHFGHRVSNHCSPIFKYQNHCGAPTDMSFMSLASVEDLRNAALEAATHTNEHNFCFDAIKNQKVGDGGDMHGPHEDGSQSDVEEEGKGDDSIDCLLDTMRSECGLRRTNRIGAQDDGGHDHQDAVDEKGEGQQCVRTSTSVDASMAEIDIENFRLRRTSRIGHEQEELASPPRTHRPPAPPRLLQLLLDEETDDSTTAFGRQASFEQPSAVHLHPVFSHVASPSALASPFLHTPSRVVAWSPVLNRSSSTMRNSLDSGETS